MVHRFDGKVALATGAGRGQGRSHAERPAAEGADVRDATTDAVLSLASARQVTGVTLPVDAGYLAE